jgi:hypothetical protein
MFIKNNIIYSEAGKYLSVQNFLGFKVFDSDTSKYTEKDFEEPEVSGQFLILGEIRTLLPEIINYENLKKKFIEWHYSNDDQLAIILNKDNSNEDKVCYDKMQEWRTWAGTMAKKVIDLINNEK